MVQTMYNAIIKTKIFKRVQVKSRQVCLYIFLIAKFVQRKVWIFVAIGYYFLHLAVIQK